MQDYRKLQIYNEAKELTIEIYSLTKYFPKDELFGVTQQLRRAGISVGANIAEGDGRISRKDFVRFLHNSLGSLNEIEHLLIMSKELNYIEKNECEKLSAKISSIRRMTCQFVNRLVEA